MDREQTPLKQRQKRGAARQPAPGGAAERAFRSSSVSQRGRSKGPAADKAASPAAILAKPPLTILRAQATGGNGGAGSRSPSPMAAAVPPTKTLYSPPPPPPPTPSRQQPPLQQQRNSMLRVNTASPSTPVTFASPSPSPSPLAVASTPQAGRKPSTPGNGSSVVGAAPPPSVLQRPSSVSAVPPFVSPPPSATKLIAANFQFASDIPTRLASCLDLTNFTVVGVLGAEGSGKSTLLSLLARLAFSSAASAGEAFDSMATLRDPTKNSHFLAQRLETQLAGLQETQGVDLAVACEAQRLRANTGGLVLLDSQPLLSASHLAEVLARNDSSGAAAAAAARFGALSPEQQNELASIQIAILLLSVCHYIIVPVSGQAGVDLEMIEFLRKVHDKMQQCRLPNVSGHVVKDKHHAQLLFVANEVATREPATSESKALRSLGHLLPAEWIYRPSRTSDVPLWKFETFDATKSERTIENWRAHALQWARFVESLPASSSFTRPSSTSAPTAPSPLTLKEWLSNTARVWESVKRSSALTEEYTTRDHY